MNVLVTGGARRLGARLSRLFAAQGDAVGVHFNASAAQAESLVDEIRRQGGSAHAFALDLARLSTLEQAADFIRDVRESLGGLDLLINNGAVFEYDEPGALSPPLLRRAVQVNALAPVYLMEAFLRQAVPDGATRRPMVINILDAKLQALNPDYLSYTLSKGMLAQATTLYAMRYGETARVYGIAPSMFAESGPHTVGRVEELVRLNPLGHPISTEDLCQAVLFVATGALRSGEILTVDGGQALWRLPRDVAFLNDSE